MIIKVIKDIKKKLIMFNKLKNHYKQIKKDFIKW